MPTDNGKPTQKCPHCQREVGNDYPSEFAHMDQYHPEIVAERQAEADRLRGWVQD